MMRKDAVEAIMSLGSIGIHYFTSSSERMRDFCAFLETGGLGEAWGPLAQPEYMRAFMADIHNTACAGCDVPIERL